MIIDIFSLIPEKLELYAKLIDDFTHGSMFLMCVCFAIREVTMPEF